MGISIAFLFVSFCYFTNEDVFGLLSFENEKNDTQLNLHSIDERKIRLKRGTNALANLCPSGWTQVGASCYNRPNLTMNFTDSVNYCAANDSTLPIFYNASEYLSFQTWWNNITNNTEVWLGITYDPASEQWLWLNNCTWKNFPAFWRKRWDKGGLVSAVYYAKYSNVKQGSYAPTGVEPILSSLKTNLNVVCYRPIDQSTSGCYEFPFERNNSFLCNTGGWWCATEYSLGQTVSTAVASNSCFCLNYNNSNLSPVEESCNNFNGTLADIRSDEEIQMIITLVDNITNSTAIQDFMCPLGFSYFNGSCFIAVKPNSPTYSSKPGVNADQYCRNNLSAQSTSVHSFDEQWFLYHLYLTTLNPPYGDNWLYLGAYKNDTSVNFTYHWNDGSPMDYIPEWGLYSFLSPENNKYAIDGVDIMLKFGDGKLGDDDSILYFACRSQIQSYPVYPILVSSAQNNLLNKNKTFSPSNSVQNVISKLCRKDRTLATSTTSTTTVTETPSISKGNMCQNGWTQIGSSCYYRPNLTMNFNDSVNYCTAKGSTLPIFYNASEYLSFENWWNTITNNTEVWLGITYDPASEQWLWLNNCTWKNFPAFWRTPWYSLTSIVYYAKYSNKINSQYAPTGVEPVSNYLDTKLDVVCYQPGDESTSGCYEFSFEKNSSFLCNVEGWWCATEHPLGQTVSTAVASDSCFCLDYNNVSLSSAEGSCNNINGTLADFRSDDEFQMITTLINNITLNKAIQDFMCPLGFSYFNGSCFTILKPGQPTYSQYGGVNADQYCRNNLSAQSASLHSFDEQWFLYHLYLTMGFTYDEYVYLGAYKNDTSVNFTYKWYDGSPMDYIPEWGLYSFTVPENNDYSHIGINIVISPNDGKIGDDYATGTIPFACRSQILNYPVYPILISSRNLLNKDKTSSPANPTQNVMSKLCRKDRAITPSTTSTTTVQGTSLVTSINTSLQSTTTIMVVQTAAATSIQTDTETSTYLQTPETTGKILQTTKTSLTMQSTTENVPTTTSANESPVNPMSATEQLIAKVISSIGCIWIAATTALSFVTGAFLSRKSYSFEQKLRMIEEFLLCLAHILIATLTSRFNEKIVCSLTSLALQYVFTSFFMFLMIESLQTYCIYTNVISSGQCLPMKVITLLGLVVPGLLVLPVAIFGFNRLSSTFSCFVNYSDGICLANVLPILLICIISIVTTESNGMHLFEDLPLTCIFQRHSAIVSKHALFFKIPLTISSWVLMTFGLHYQKFYWFACIFGVNVALGWVCFLSHFIGNEEVKRLFHKLVKNKI